MGVEATELEDGEKEPMKSEDTSFLIGGLSEAEQECLEETLSVTQSVEHSGVIDTSPAMDTQCMYS